MNRREVLIAIAAATMAVAVSWAGTPAAPPPPPPPVPVPQMNAVRPWESFCIGSDKAHVEQTWANDDLDKEVGWNRVIQHYAAAGWEPFQLLTVPSDTKRGVAIISAVCFRRPG